MLAAVCCNPVSGIKYLSIDTLAIHICSERFDAHPFHILVKTNMVLTCLPTELVVEILKYLDVSQLSRAMQTCRQLNVVAAHDMLWKRFVSSNKNLKELVRKLDRRTKKQLGWTLQRKINHLIANGQMCTRCFGARKTGITVSKVQYWTNLRYCTACIWRTFECKTRMRRKLKATFDFKLKEIDRMLKTTESVELCVRGSKGFYYNVDQMMSLAKMTKMTKMAGEDGKMAR